jgi:hypothetical protein
MTTLIIGGIALIVGTNWLYSRFCERSKEK